MYADPEVMRYVGDGRTLTRSETERSVRRMIERWEADGFGLFTTVRKDDEAVIGRVGLLVWNTDTWEPTTRAEAADVPSEVEVGYTLGRDYWGQGFATEAAGAVRDYALGELGAGRLIALIIHGNTASENVARKLGLEYERNIMLGRREAQLFALEPCWQDEDASRVVGGTKTPAEVDRMMERTVRHWDWFGIGNFTVERREDGAILGRVGFLIWNPETWENGHRVQLEQPYVTELGWKLGREAWGRGYATEAALACRDWALGERGLTRVISLIALENTPSIRVAEQIGESFERELEPSPFQFPAGMWSLGEKIAP